MGANDPRGGAIFDPRGMVGRIYKEDHYTLLNTKYESSRPCDFGKEDFFYVFFFRTPLGWCLYGSQGMVGRIYKEDHYTLLMTKYESFGPCCFREEDFYAFPIVSLWELMTPRVWPLLTPGAWLAGFIKRTTIHCFIQNMKALGLVVSEKKCFLFFP